MTEREQKLQRTLEWLIGLIEDAVNKTDDYAERNAPCATTTVSAPPRA